jgi:hypothetical protein
MQGTTERKGKMKKLLGILTLLGGTLAGLIWAACLGILTLLGGTLAGLIWAACKMMESLQNSMDLTSLN